MNHEVLKTVGWSFAMTPDEAENVLKVCGWQFETRNGLHYVRHETEPATLLQALIGHREKSKAIKLAWREQFGKHIVLS